jgi:hypothetical protein
MQCSGPLFARLSAAVLVAGLGAVACSGGPPAHFATPSSLPPQSTETNSAVTAVDPASFPETQAGATGFIRAFFDVYRATFSSGDTKSARAFIDPSCDCFPVLDLVDQHTRRDEHYSGLSVDFGGLDVQMGPDSALALYYTSSSSGAVVSAAGSPVATLDSGSPTALSMQLSWRGRWWITAVRKP